MQFPNDPVMLLSTVNTALRDHYENLEELCLANDISKEDIAKKLAAIDYTYDSSQNQFI